MSISSSINCGLITLRMAFSRDEVSGKMTVSTGSMKPPKFDATYESDAVLSLGQGRQPHRTSKLRAANSIDRRPRFIGARRRAIA
jgi:hypothetical protein